MGGRANVIVKEGTEKINLYTHWGGSELPNTVQRALARRQRWDDFSYLTRIIFCTMVPIDMWDDETGFGISQHSPDGEDRTITVDVGKQSVKITGQPAVTFDKYVKHGGAWLDD